MFSMSFIFNSILTICIYFLMLRLWMQYLRVSYHNPCTQFIIKVTQPVIGPLSNIIPSKGRFDTTTAILLYICALGKLIGFFLFNLQIFILPFIIILSAFVDLIFWMLLIRAILSWLSQGNSALEEILYQLTEPLVAPIRRFIPPIGNIDISFMVFIFILFLLNNCISNFLFYLIS